MDLATRAGVHAPPPASPTPASSRFNERVRGAARSSRIVALATTLAIGTIALLGFIDHQRSADASLEDFAREQVVVAEGIAAGLTGQLAPATSVAPPSLDVHALEKSGDLVVLTSGDGSPVLHASSGREYRLPTLDTAIARGLTTAELTRAEAAQVGLPSRRRAEVGFARATTARGTMIIAVVASALRIRDRDVRAEWRLVIEFLLTACCALAFGAYALRAQQERLALSGSWP